jgi:hypothetical protein
MSGMSMKSSMQFVFLGGLVIVCAIWSQQAPAIASMLQHHLNQADMQWASEQKSPSAQQDDEQRAREAIYVASLSAGYPAFAMASYTPPQNKDTQVAEIPVTRP